MRRHNGDSVFSMVVFKRIEVLKMIITKSWLEKWDACSSGVAWFFAQTETNSKSVIKKLIAENKLDWASWTICRIFNRRQKMQC